MDLEHGILLILMGIPFAILVMYVILMVMSNERMDDKDSDNTI